MSKIVTSFTDVKEGVTTTAGAQSELVAQMTAAAIALNFILASIHFLTQTNASSHH